MKNILSIIIFLVMAVAAFAQTPKEIIDRMSAEWDKHEAEGMGMTLDTKIPVLGTVTITDYSLGKKNRGESDVMGTHVSTWDDGVTAWAYNAKTNKLKITNSTINASYEGNSDADLFTGVSNGYDLSIKEETADSWLILCKKSKTNQDKDAPKNIEIRVAKGTFYPISLKTKMSGFPITIRDITFGISEDLVTFHPEDYPDAIIEDEREKK